MARKEIDKFTRNRGETFAERLKKERKKLAYSQDELSKLSNVPLDTVRSIENGRISTPGLFIAADLVHALNGKLDEWIAKNKKG